MTRFYRHPYVEHDIATTFTFPLVERFLPAPPLRALSNAENAQVAT